MINVKNYSMLLVILLVLIGQDGSAADQSAIFDKSNAQSGVLQLNDGSSPYLDIDTLTTGELQTSFTNQGTFGKGYTPYNDFASFETPLNSGIEYLFAGALWVGGIIRDDTLVSTGKSSWQIGHYEMWPDFDSASGEMGKYAGSNGGGNWIMRRAEFTDTLTDPTYVDFDAVSGRPHQPLNLRIANRGYAWDAESLAVVYDMVITNIGAYLINDASVGFFMDGDAGSAFNYVGHNDDLAGSLRDEGIGYIIDNDGYLEDGEMTDFDFVRALAFKFLDNSFESSDSSFNWWYSSSQAPLDYGPRMRGTEEDPFFEFWDGATNVLGTPMGDINKYYMLRHKEWDFDQVYTGLIDSTNETWIPPNQRACDIAYGFDTRFMMSLGSFDLPPDSSVRVIFTLFTGDSIHVDPDNWERFYCADPSIFVSSLKFDGDKSLTDVAAAAKSFSEYLKNPQRPVFGVQAEFSSRDSVVIEWDPSVYDEIDGYNIYLTEVDYAAWPYAGVIPPWIENSVFELEAEVGRTYRHTFYDLNPGSAYFVQLANRTSGYIGELSRTYTIVAEDYLSCSPDIKQEYVFDSIGTTAVLNWLMLEDFDLDHFNIYKFDNIDSANLKFSRYYDKGESGRIPKDSFNIESEMFYYYAMDVYDQVDLGMTTYSDATAADGEVYLITAVSKNGFESGFSSPITFYDIPTRSNDVLVLSKLKRRNYAYVLEDTIKNFYDDLFNLELAGEYDFAFYSIDDTIDAYTIDHKPTFEEVFDWKEMALYKCVIIEDGLIENSSYSINAYENATGGMTKFLMSGGKLCYFGDPSESFLSDPNYRYQTTSMARDLFGVDTTTNYGVYGFFVIYSLANDTLTGFIGADGSGSYPYVGYDTLRFPYDIENSYYLFPLTWFNGFEYAPMVTTFSTNEYGEAILTYDSYFPDTSLQHGDAVGVKCQTDDFSSYLFGFHLWYMNMSDAAELIRVIMDEDCPSFAAQSEYEVSICELGEVSLDVRIANFDSLATNIGKWDNDRFMFTPDDSGLYEATITAFKDDCQREKSVDINVVLDNPINVDLSEINFFGGVATIGVDSQMIIIDSDCPNADNWAMHINGTDWISASAYSGGYPDSVWIYFDNNLPENNYKSWLSISCPQSIDTVYIVVNYTVSKGVVVGNATVNANETAVVPIYTYANESVYGYTIPIKGSSNSEHSLDIGNIYLNDSHASLVVDTTNDIYLIQRPYQDAPIYVYNDEAPIATVVINVTGDETIDTLQLEIIDTALSIGDAKEIYQYGYFDESGLIIAPQLQPGYVYINHNPIPVDVTEIETELLPSEFSLQQNYPNPFNPTTTIQFSLPERSDVSIDVYNILGQKVISLVNDQYSSGTYSIQWDGFDENGRGVGTGIYFYRIQAGNFVETKKMVLLK